MKEKGAERPRPRSGWVSEEQRHTERLLVRCPPELAARVRALLSKTVTLADVLRAGVEAMEADR